VKEKFCNADVNGSRKSDNNIVPEKPANKEGRICGDMRVYAGSDPSNLLLLQENTHKKGLKTVLECTFRGLKGYSKDFIGWLRLRHRLRQCVPICAIQKIVSNPILSIKLWQFLKHHFLASKSLYWGSDPIK